MARTRHVLEVANQLRHKALLLVLCGDGPGAAELLTEADRLWSGGRSEQAVGINSQDAAKAAYKAASGIDMDDPEQKAKVYATMARIEKERRDQLSAVADARAGAGRPTKAGGRKKTRTKR